MANARTTFDILANDLQQHEATQIMLYGRHCLCVDGEPFLMLYKEGVGFRLAGHDLASALAVPDAQPFDPLTPEHPSPARPGWVWVPGDHFLLWNGYANAAMHWARLAQTRNVSWQVPEAVATDNSEAPASSPDALAKRAAASLKGGFGFGLATPKD